MAMVGRDKQGITGYRYGYNGMEIDPEMKGKGNEYTTEFRQYDPRVGRWMSLDPLMMQFPWMSPYCAFDNNPVLLNDIYGLSTGDNEPVDPPKNKVTQEDNGTGGTDPTYTVEVCAKRRDSKTNDPANGVFEKGRYYGLGANGWEERSCVDQTAVSAEMAMAANQIVSEMNQAQRDERDALELAHYMRPINQAIQKEAEYDHAMSQNPLGLFYQVTPFSAIKDVTDNVGDGHYATAAGLALIEFTPFDEVSDVIRASKKAFRQHKKLNPPGFFMDCHHLVEQNETNLLRFGVPKIQHADNMVNINRALHWTITGHYNSRLVGSNFRLVRDYVNSLSLAEQRAYAIQTLIDAGFQF